MEEFVVITLFLGAGLIFLAISHYAIGAIMFVIYKRTYNGKLSFRQYMKLWE